MKSRLSSDNSEKIYRQLFDKRTTLVGARYDRMTHVMIKNMVMFSAT